MLAGGIGEQAGLPAEGYVPTVFPPFSGSDNVVGQTNLYGGGTAAYPPHESGLMHFPLRPLSRKQSMRARTRSDCKFSGWDDLWQAQLRSILNRMWFLVDLSHCDVE